MLQTKLLHFVTSFFFSVCLFVGLSSPLTLFSLPTLNQQPAVTVVEPQSQQSKMWVWHTIADETGVTWWFNDKHNKASFVPPTPPDVADEANNKIMGFFAWFDFDQIDLPPGKVETLKIRDNDQVVAIDTRVFAKLKGKDREFVKWSKWSDLPQEVQTEIVKIDRLRGKRTPMDFLFHLINDHLQDRNVISDPKDWPIFSFASASAKMQTWQALTQTGITWTDQSKQTPTPYFDFIRQAWRTKIDKQVNAPTLKTISNQQTLLDFLNHAQITSLKFTQNKTTHTINTAVLAKLISQKTQLVNYQTWSDLPADVQAEITKIDLLRGRRSPMQFLINLLNSELTRPQEVHNDDKWINLFISRRFHDQQLFTYQQPQPQAKVKKTSGWVIVLATFGGVFGIVIVGSLIYWLIKTYK